MAAKETHPLLHSAAHPGLSVFGADELREAEDQITSLVRHQGAELDLEGLLVYTLPATLLQQKTLREINLRGCLAHVKTVQPPDRPGFHKPRLGPVYAALRADPQITITGIDKI